MNAIDQEFLQRKLGSLLERRSPPRAIQGNPDHIRDEAASLLRAVIRVAPSRPDGLWWQRFEDALLGQMDTNSWPLQKQIVKAGQKIGGGGGQANPEAARVKMIEWAHQLWFDGSEKTGLPPRTALPACCKDWVAHALIQSGADAMELRNAGYPLTLREVEQVTGAVLRPKRAPVAPAPKSANPPARSLMAEVPQPVVQDFEPQPYREMSEGQREALAVARGSSQIMSSKGAAQ